MEDLKDGMCRCCASEGTFKDFTASYQWMGVEEIYSEMLRDCFDITLSTSLLNNGGICELCITQLRNAFNFKKQVQSTEEQFTKMQDRFLKGDIVKKELNQDPMENSDGGDNIDDDFSSPEYDVPIQSIKLEKIDTKTKKRPARATTSKAKKPKVEAGEPSGKRPRRSHTDDHDDQCVGKRKKGVELEKHRFNLVEILRNSNITPIRCRGGIGYVCFYCEQEYIDPADLKTHTLNEHEESVRLRLLDGKDLYKFHAKLDITDLKCKLCEIIVDTLDEFIQHLIGEHQINLHTDIKNQLFPFKFDVGALKCCICDVVYHKFKSLLEHMNIHYRNYICKECDVGFVSRSSLTKHAKGHKLGVFNCDHCVKVFDTYRKKRSHEKFIHTRAQALNKCGYCDEKFRDYRQKERHLIDAHGVFKEMVCLACDRVFNNQKEYSSHVKRSHLMEKRHQCHECDMAFYTTSELKNHIVKHTGERSFVCEVCNKAYGRQKTLKEHVRIHMDDRRFKCEHCGKAFVQKCGWRGHMWSKHGENS